MLVPPGPAQDYCAQSGFDHSILQLIEFCIRVLLRGYDGEPGGTMEDAYTNILEGIKRMLLESLDILNNLISFNDNRHLQLWLDLFCHQAKRPSSNGQVGPHSERLAVDDTSSPGTTRKTDVATVR